MDLDTKAELKLAIDTFFHTLAQGIRWEEGGRCTISVWAELVSDLDRYDDPAEFRKSACKKLGRACRHEG